MLILPKLPLLRLFNETLSLILELTSYAVGRLNILLFLAVRSIAHGGSCTACWTYSVMTITPGQALYEVLGDTFMGVTSYIWRSSLRGHSYIRGSDK